MKWITDELQMIVQADDLHVAPLRADGQTFGTPTWIWCVSVEGDLYVRAYNGQNSRWYQAAMQQRSGRILAAGMTKDVFFSSVSGALIDQIDEAYRIKYRERQYLRPMLSGHARAATVKIEPRDLQAGL